MFGSFLAGFLCAIAAAVWGLSNRRRATWVAQLLLRAAGPSKRTYTVKRDWQPGDDWDGFKKLSKRKQLTHQYAAWQKFGSRESKPVSAEADSFVESL
jgi:hypothetical protein